MIYEQYAPFTFTQQFKFLLVTIKCMYLYRYRLDIRRVVKCYCRKCSIVCADKQI